MWIEFAIEDLKCKLFGEAEENVSHLFFPCMFAYEVWCDCLNWLKILGAQHFPPNICDMFGSGTRQKKGTVSVWSSVIWLI